MSETGKTDAGRTWRGVPEEQAVRDLLEQAGPREAPPADDLAAIAAAARAEWRKRYAGLAGAGAAAEAAEPVGRDAERGAADPVTAGPAGEVDADRAGGTVLRPAGGWSRTRRWLPLAAAAALAIAAGLAWWAVRSGPPPGAAAAVAAIEVWSGEVRITPPGSDVPLALDAAARGRELAAGTAIETGTGAPGGETGRLALRTAGGASLRLDAGTRVRLASATSIALDRGAVYVDSPAVGDLAIATAAGTFREIGTRFEVRTGAGGAAAGTRLRVREGRVALDRGAEPAVAAAGEELTVRPDGGLDRAIVGLYGSEWDWTLAAAPMPAIEGRPVREFLDWLARETGRRLDYADAEAAALAESTILHGSIDHLTPAEAPEVVLPSTGLGHRAADGTLVVFVVD